MSRYSLGAVLLLVLGVPSTAHAKCSDPPRTQVNWAGCDKRNAQLSRANLEGANLQGANLRGARLDGASLLSANLTDANLQGANLQGAHLGGASLLSANLTDADLTGANLNGANLSCVIFTGATLSRTRWNNRRMCNEFSPKGRCQIVYSDWEITSKYHKNDPVYYPRPGANDRCAGARGRGSY